MNSYDEYFGVEWFRIQDIEYENKNELFLKACEDGDLPTVQKLWTNFDEIGTLLGYGIYWASNNNHIAVVEEFLKKDFSNFISIDVAIRKKHNDIVYLILDRHREKYNFDMEEFMEKACAAGNLDVVKYLASYPMVITPTMIFASAYNNHIHVLKYLLKKDLATVQLQSLVETLIKHGCDYFEEAKIILDFHPKIKPKMTKEFKRFLEIVAKLTLRAQKKIYFWWIQICYDLKRPVGQRMMERSWKKFQKIVKL